MDEEGSPLVMEYTRKSLFAATSRVVYAEARSAFARSYRAGILGERAYREVIANFKEEWSAFFALDVTDGEIHPPKEWTKHQDSCNLSYGRYVQ